MFPRLDFLLLFLYAYIYYIANTDKFVIYAPCLGEQNLSLLGKTSRTEILTSRPDTKIEHFHFEA